MTKIIILILYILAHLVTYGLLIFGYKKLNFDKEQRFLHSYMLVANVCTVIFAILTYKYFLILINYLMRIEVVYYVVTGAFPNNSFDLGFMFFIFDISNITYLMLLTIVKSSFRSRSRDLVEFPEGYKHFIFRFIAGLFYDLEDYDSPYFPLKKGKEIIGKWFRAIQFIFLAMFAGEIIFIIVELWIGIPHLTTEKFAYEVRQLYLLPMMSYGLMAEFSYFLMGDMFLYEKKEYERDNLSYKALNNYHLIMKILKERFKGYLLYDEKTIGTIEAPVFSGITEKQKKIARESEEKLTHILDMVSLLTNRHSSTYEDAMLELIQRKDAIIFDTFDGLIAPYLVAFIQLRLHQGEKIMFICRNDEEEALLRHQLEETFRTINNLSPIWKIKAYEDFLEDAGTDILCVSIKDISNENIFIRYREFLSRVSVCVVTCTLDFCAVPRFVSDMFLKHMRDYSSEKDRLQFIFISEQRSRQTELAVESYLGGRDISSYTNDSELDCCGIMVWKEENISKDGGKGRPQEELGLKGEVNIGMGLSLSLVAIKMDVNNIYVYGPDAPVRAFLENQVVLQDKINSYIGRQTSLLQTISDTSRPIYNSNDLSFTVVYDRLNHVGRAAEIWKNYGGSSYALLNIISRPYMLREFFADTLVDGKSMIPNGADFTAILPVHSTKLDMELITLMLRMYEGKHGVTGVETERVLKEHELWPEDNNIWKALSKMLKVVLPGVMDNKIQINELFQVKEDYIFGRDLQKNDYVFVRDDQKDEYIKTLFVSLTEKKIYDALNRYYSMAIYEIGKEETGYLPCLTSDIENRYLPGQKVVVGQQAYEVEEITNDRHVQLTRLQNIDIGETYQIREFNLKLDDLEEEETDSICVRQKITGSVDRKIYGYVRLNNGITVANDSDYISKVYGEGQEIITDYPRRHILRIVLKAPDGNDIERLYITLATMLNELFKTAFPLSWQDIVVLTPYISGQFAPVSENSQEQEQMIWSMLPRMNSDVPEGLYIVGLSHNESRVDSMIDNNENWNGIISVLNSYVEWLLQKPKYASPGEDKYSYMKFGLADYPFFFDVRTVQKWLDAMVEKQADNTGEELVIQSGNRCCFCGEAIIGQGILIEPGNNARLMCENCNAHAVRNLDEVQELYVKARKRMRRYYSIEGKPIALPPRISVKFKSAKNIASRNKTSGGGRVLGFYNPRNHELWIERGGPVAFTLSTIYHELTHAWQFESRRVKKVKNLQRTRLDILEGHAVYVEIECLKKSGQKRYAERLQKNYAELYNQNPNDPYGAGFVLFDNNMPYSPCENVFEAMALEEPLNWRRS